MAEKVRYYLEQSVPELEDLQKKGLFNKKEITLIMRRRTDFEHRITGRGSTARDFLKYADFESNLERLRKKRYTRLSKVGLVDKKPSVSDWAGARRILFVYERGTNRFPKNLEIWSKYLEFAKKNGAIKVVYKIYSRLLQLQPRNVAAWLSAAKYEFEVNNNAKGTRVLFQRGLRLNPESLEMWLNYCQFELTYISKLLARRKVLGLITEKQQLEQMELENAELKQKLEQGDQLEDDIIALPNEDLRDELNHLPEADMNMLGNPETNPALKGDVALAIFDSCIPALVKTITSKDEAKTKEKIMSIVEAFVKIVDNFGDLNQDYLYLHMVNYLHNTYPKEVKTMLIDSTLPVRGIDKTDPSFADNLQLAMNKLRAFQSGSEHKSELSQAFIAFLQERFLSSQDQANERIDTVLRAIIKKCKV